VTVAGDNWHWGATRENQEKLQPILCALQKLQVEGLTAAGSLPLSTAGGCSHWQSDGCGFRK
jgi:hypothetical protein